MKNSSTKAKKTAEIFKFPAERKVPRPPRGLEKAGRQLWRSIQAEYAIDDAAGLAFLHSACHAEDDIIRWRGLVAKEGDTIPVLDKPPVAHPLLPQIRGAEQIKRQALRGLNLDIEPLRDKPGRPPGS